MMDNHGVPITGREVSDDRAYEQVNSLRAKVARLQRENAALQADRKGLLEEYSDLQHARAVPKAHKVKRRSHKSDTLRVSVGDVHGMRMDRMAVDAFLSDMRLLSPDVIVLGGDMLECGGHLARHQPVGYVALCDYTYQEDIRAANQFLDELIAAAPSAKIHYIEGNHEHRVERWCVDETMAKGRDAEFLREVYGPEALLRLKDRGIPFYRQGEVYGKGLPRGWIKLGNMYFTHQLGKSKNAARDSAAKTAGHVTYFHTHREDAATIVFPAVGLVKAFNPGCLSEMQPIWKHSDPTTWSQGYGIDIIAKSGNFQRVHVTIWRGDSLCSAMVERFKS
jgi:hypothetical protein